MTSTRRITPAGALAFVALLVALGGSSFAAPVRDAATKMIGGGQIKNNSITSKDVKNKSLTKADFKGGLPRGAQGAQGPQGPRGAQGIQGNPGTPGTPGAPASSHYAMAQSDGTLVQSRSKGVVSVTKDTLNAGTYDVKFNRNIQACSPVATQVSDISSPAAGGITVSYPLNAMVPQDEIRVQARNSAGAFADVPFTIALYCN